MILTLKRIAHWWDPGKPIRTLLHEARERLPSDTPSPVIDHKTDEYRLEHFDGFIEHAEYELALGVLVYVADACEEAGLIVPDEFWARILRASELMELKIRPRPAATQVRHDEGDRNRDVLPD